MRPFHIAALAGAFVVAQVWSAQAQSLSELYEKAKLEKSLHLYGAGPAQNYAGPARDFEKQFPQIKITITGGYSNELTSKIEAQNIGNQSLNVGSIFIPVQNQSKSSEAIFTLIQNEVKKTGVKVFALKTSLATEGVDLGSPSTLAIRKPNVALLVGEGVTNNDAGEVWHLLDTRYNMQVTLLDVASARWKLDGYTCVIMPDGSYSAAVAGRIKEYLSSGGTVAAFGKAVRFLKTNDLCNVDFKTSKSIAEKNKRRPYNSSDEEEGTQQIRGAIFEAEADLTHPLLYGYRSPKSLFPL